MKKMENKGLLIGILACVIAIILVGGYGMMTAEPVSVTNNPAPVIVQEQVNLTATNAEIALVKAKVYEDSNFKDACKVIATAEFTDREYKDIFNFIEANQSDINEKEDIISVKITDEDVTDFDVTDKTCDVTQYVTVKYDTEDGSGYTQTKKLYLVIDSEIDTGDVDSQEITLE